MKGRIFVPASTNRGKTKPVAKKRFSFWIDRVLHDNLDYEKRTVVSIRRTPDAEYVTIYLYDFERTMNDENFLKRVRLPLVKKLRKINEEDNVSSLTYVPSDRIPDFDMRRCNFCFRRNRTDGKILLACSDCGVTCYCDETCQRTDRPGHRKQCPLLRNFYRFKEDELDFRAVRDTTDYDTFCRNCGELLTSDSPDCDECGMRFCSTYCRSVRDHCCREYKISRVYRKHAPWFVRFEDHFPVYLLSPEHTEGLKKPAYLIHRREKTGDGAKDYLMLSILDHAINMARLEGMDCVVRYDVKGYVCANDKCPYERYRTLCEKTICANCDLPVHPVPCAHQHACDGVPRRDSNEGCVLNAANDYEKHFAKIERTIGNLIFEGKKLREGRMTLMMDVNERSESPSLPLKVCTSKVCVYFARCGDVLNEHPDILETLDEMDFSVTVGDSSFANAFVRFGRPCFFQCAYCAKTPFCGRSFDGNKICFRFGQCGECRSSLLLRCDKKGCSTRYCGEECKEKDAHAACTELILIK